ncbi:MAG TPA: hypothetical protein EYP98_19025 [Planctomycetes bacterium]|nr:hypothetical protein [Planctomycetota bacterium]
MAYDSARGKVVMFGGWNGSSHLNDTWEYDGTEWHPIRRRGDQPRRTDARWSRQASSCSSTNCAKASKAAGIACSP